MEDINYYDFIFSLGDACPCSILLREAGLQTFSNPFDWVKGDTFINRINLICSRFYNFLKFEDLEYISCNYYPEKFDRYKNKRNGMLFFHDFTYDVDLTKSFPLVKDKYDRRIARFNATINKSNKVLAVYIESLDNGIIVNDCALIEAVDRLNAFYNVAKIDLLYLQHNEKFACNEMNVKQIGIHVTKIELFNKNYNDDWWKINYEQSKKIFCNIKLRTKNNLNIEK